MKEVLMKLEVMGEEGELSTLHHALCDCWDGLLATSQQAIKLDDLEPLSEVEISREQWQSNGRGNPKKESVVLTAGTGV
jgi:hypothetical protein